MNLIELQRALTQLRLGGIAAVLETRFIQLSPADPADEAPESAPWAQKE